MAFYLGLMLGSSADAIDAAIIDITNENITLLASYAQRLDEPLRQQLLNVATGQLASPTLYWQLEHQISKAAVSAAQRVIQSAQLICCQIAAVGVHGYTCLHQPEDLDHPTSVQLVDANVIAQALGVPVVSDFRRMDIAAGGQGAPLAPAFHATLWQRTHPALAVVNIGGMANVTAWQGRNLHGFDTGPGNVWLDAWVQQHRSQPYDNGGEWAASGRVQHDLLSALKTIDFFQQAPPKSTGRDVFNIDHLDRILAQGYRTRSSHDIQATLAEITAWSIASAVQTYTPWVRRVAVCGGGAHNHDLLNRIRGYLSAYQVHSTQVLGWHPDWIEASAFAWLAYLRLVEKVVPIASVTGAKHNCLLGGIYQAAKQMSQMEGVSD